MREVFSTNFEVPLLFEWPTVAELSREVERRLCAGESLWGKAREHMVKSLELEPSSLGYDAFGQLLQRQGELEPAMVCFRNALRMTQGQKPEPLPSVTARLSAP